MTSHDDESLRKAAFRAETSAYSSPTSKSQRLDPTLLPTPSVFIIHGRNQAALSALKLFLTAISIRVLSFDDVAIDLARSHGGSPFVGDIVRAGLDRAGAIIALFTPDEYASLNPQYREEATSGRWQSRPNVIFEAGMALGMKPDKTVLVTIGADVSLFSDVNGRHIVHLSNEPSSRERLLKRLTSMGCAPKTENTDWLSPVLAGDFDRCGTDTSTIKPKDPFRVGRRTKA